jgi:glycosyltransferase involved in cell wall biosynthesis
MTKAHTAPVSAVVPCWRATSTIRRALSSIAAQTLRPAEVILVDDASGDDTLRALHELAAEHAPGWVRVLSLPRNQGPGGARNAGWDQATQPWIAFLDADDAWHPRKLEIQFNWLQAHPEVALCAHATAVANGFGSGPDLPEDPKFRAWRVGSWQMLVSNRFPTRSVLLRRQVPFRFEQWHHSEDYLLWLRIVLAGLPCFRLELPLAFSFRPDASAGGLSGQLWRHEKRELAALHMLYREGAISAPTWGAATVWSLTKYVRRTLS